MELFTLVSLLIGIFGATLAALTTVKNLLGEDFHRVSEDAKQRAEAIISVSGDGHAATDLCSKLRDNVIMCKRFWKYIAVVQAGFFTLSIYAVTFAALNNWSDLVLHHTDGQLAILYAKGLFWGLTPKATVETAAYLNLTFLAIALGVFARCRYLFKRISVIGDLTAAPRGGAAEARPSPPVDRA